MLTLILKGTNGCNLNCAYCSLGEKPEHCVISESILYQALRFAAEDCIRRGDRALSVILHGGEPTLVPIQTYRFAFERIRMEYPALSIKIMMQTNAYALSREYLDFCKEYQISVGVSIDGSQMIHDAERRTQGDRPSFTQVLQNIDRMQDEGISVACLMVLTRMGVSAPIDFLELYASRGLSLKINPLLNYGEAEKHPELALRPGEYAAYLIRVFEYILTHELDLDVSPLGKILRAILCGGLIGECTFNPRCNEQFLCIDHLGDVYPCGKLSDAHEFRLGNVASLSDSWREHPRMKYLAERRSCKLPDPCRRCSYLKLCGAGCSAEALIEQTEDLRPVLCEDYQILFQYFYQEGLQKLKSCLLRQRAERVETINELRGLIT